MSKKPSLQTKYTSGHWYLSFEEFMAVHEAGLALLEELKKPNQYWKRDIRNYLKRHAEVIGNVAIAGERLEFYRLLKNMKPTHPTVWLQSLLDNSWRFYSGMKLLVK